MPTQTCSYSSSRTIQWLLGHGLSFTVKPWASRGIPTVYEQSCQASNWSQNAPCARLSLAACIVTQSSDSYHDFENKLPWVLPMHSTCYLHSHSLLCQPCSLAVALHARFHGIAEVHNRADIPSSWNICVHWFEVYGMWPVQQTSIDRHTCTMQSRWYGACSGSPKKWVVITKLVKHEIVYDDMGVWKTQNTAWNSQNKQKLGAWSGNIEVRCAHLEN